MSQETLTEPLPHRSVCQLFSIFEEDRNGCVVHCGESIVLHKFTHRMQDASPNPTQYCLASAFFLAFHTCDPVENDRIAEF